MKKQTILFLTLALGMSMCCRPDNTVKYLTDEDKTWLPYEVGDSLLFYRNDTLVETLVVKDIQKSFDGVNKYLDGCNINNTETKHIKLSEYQNLDYLFQGLIIGYSNDTLNLGECSNSVCNNNSWIKIDKIKKADITIKNFSYKDVTIVSKYHPRFPRLFYIKENVGLIRFVDRDTIIYDVIKK